MKSFIEYLYESQEAKKYAFKVKIAGDLPEHCEDVMETALQQYQVCKFSKGKSTPIQASLLDFPTAKNASMTVFEVELDYPTTSAVLSEILANATGISRDCILVRTPLEEANIELETANLNEKDGDDTALLSQDYEKSNNQDLVGEKYVSSFLKDLSKASKESQLTQYKGVNEKLLAKTTPKEKSAKAEKLGPAKSIFGSVDNPDPRKGK
jgi:hypothetical protein